MDISSVMGFTGFGKPQKVARKFDLDAIFEKTKREAKIIISHNDEKLFNFIQSIIPFNYTILDDHIEILKKIKNNYIGLINDWTISLNV